MIRDNNFITAFLQGLAVVFFLYVVIFTACVFKAGKMEQSLSSQLASVTINISRFIASDEPMTIQVQPNSLNPEDQAPVPDETQEIPAPDAVAEVHSTQENAADNYKDLVEVTPQGPMPQKSPSGLSPFDAYKTPFTDTGSPVIALAIMDYGLSESDSKEALKKLPKEVSLVLNPYIASPDIWKSLAETSGHEFWVYLPIENHIYPDHQDPGPQTLLAHSDIKYNQEKFIWALTRTTGYVGIAGFTDSAFLNAQTALKALWDEGYRRGIGYFEINPAGLEGVEMNAIEKQAPYIRNHSIFDESFQKIEQWLASLEMEAKNSGYAVGVIKTPYPKFTDAISAWALDLNSRGFALAPVSAISKVNAMPEAQPVATTPQPVTEHAAP